MRLTAELSFDSAAVYEPATSKLFCEGENPLACCDGVNPSAVFLLYKYCFILLFYGDLVRETSSAVGESS